jgi:exodeoxyribonuclease X
MPAVIRVVDFETTGIAPPAQVIEVGTCDLSGIPDWTVGEPWSQLCGADGITAETRAIHHIAPLEVKGLPEFDPFKFMVSARNGGVVALAAHRMSFESQWLGEAGELKLICTYKAALRVWPDAPSHSNQCLRYWLEEQGLTHPDPRHTMPAHRAGPDAYATAWTLKALLDRGVTGKEMVAWTREPALLPRIPIGKQRGAKWSEVEEGFLSWMLRQSDMDPDLAWNARRELDRRRAAQ